MRTLICIFFLSICGSVFSQKTNSPYLYVKSSNTNILLKSSKANVQIVGTIAQVQLTQTYQNLSTVPIEASYVFPLTTTAAIHDMQIAVGNRITKAKIFAKKEAIKVYTKALKEGKRAAKLSQHRPNVFQMNVGNILPNETINITLYYTEMMTSTQKEYEFVLPGVVGPRYTEASIKKETVFNQLYSSNDGQLKVAHDINVQINAGMMLRNVYSQSHNVNIHYPDANSAEISLSDENKNPSNRDFVLKYSLRSNSINSGLLLFEGEKENYFSLVIEPTEKVIKQEVPDREYLFVVDVSGSMMGYPIDVSKSLVRNLLSDLGENDRFNILLFSADNTVFRPTSVLATQQNLTKALQFLTGTFNNYGKGTQLLNALKTGYQLPRSNPKSARNVVVITDGFISVEKNVFSFIENNLNKANVFTFGIGNGVNRYLIDGIANVSNSMSFVATNKKDAYTAAKAFKNYIVNPLLTQIKLQTTNFDIYDVTPKSIPDVFSDRPIVIYGKYKGSAAGKIQISGYQGHQKFKQTIRVSNGTLRKEHKALKYLWARKKIARLIDYKRNFGTQIKQQVIDLGIQYNLATEFTSFVAVDHEIVNKNGKLIQRVQPLPKPKNVTFYAVGAEASIVGKSSYKKSYSIQFSVGVKAPQKRAIKMWIKTTYSTLLKKYLKIYGQLKIYLDKNGKIKKIEKKYNNAWTVDNQLKQKFTNIPKQLKLQKNINIVITLK